MEILSRLSSLADIHHWVNFQHSIWPSWAILDVDSSSPGIRYFQYKPPDYPGDGNINCQRKDPIKLSISVLHFRADIFQMLVLTYLSEVINQRALLGLLVEFWTLPCVVALALLPEHTSRWGSYALVTVLLAHPSRKAIQL